MTITFSQLYKEGQQKLDAAGKDGAAFDARALLSFVTDIPFREIPLHYADEVSEEQRVEFNELIRKRLGGEPLQYITGEQEFMGLTFHVDPRVLIPRLDTEILAEEALKYVKEKLYGQAAAEIRVLDMCCGSGAIGISIAALAGKEPYESYKSDGAELSDISEDALDMKPPDVSEDALDVVLSDISEDVLDVARQNAEALGVLENVSFIQSDLFEKVQGDFDLIVCNPPYVRSDVIPGLDEEVRLHEPMLALDGGADGLDIFRRIAVDAPGHLKSGGCLMMEIGYDQADEVETLLSHDFDDIYVKKDLAELDRVIIAKKR